MTYPSFPPVLHRITTGCLKISTPEGKNQPWNFSSVSLAPSGRDPGRCEAASRLQCPGDRQSEFEADGHDLLQYDRIAGAGLRIAWHDDDSVARYLG